jgi:hypothetical protein
MKQTAVEWLQEALSLTFEQEIKFEGLFQQAKETEENNLLEMLHEFAFDYTYNYRGEKTIYECIPEWFEEYKRLQEKHKNK